MTSMDGVLPVRDTLSGVWFDAVAEGRLLVQRDPATGAFQMYPRGRVAGAPEREPEWVEASGRGTLYSFTVVKRSVHPQFADRTPFVLGIVALEEGCRVTAWIVDVDEAELRCDMPVKVVFREIHEGLTMPCFTKA
jgi:uncharacterized OB-fold protein